MSQAKHKNRGVAECRNCGAIIVVSVWPDDTIVPIGTEKDGKCGDGDFRLIETSPEP